VERRQSKPLGVLNEHHGGVGDVHAHFDHRGGHQDLGGALLELLHHPLLLLARQPAVQQAHAELGEDVARQVFVHANGGTQVERLRLLNQGIDHVGLLARLHLGADELEGAGTLLLPQEPGLDGRAIRRQLVDHGKVEVPVEGEG